MPRRYSKKISRKRNTNKKTSRKRIRKKNNSRRRNECKKVPDGAHGFVQQEIQILTIYRAERVPLISEMGNYNPYV